MTRATEMTDAELAVYVASLREWLASFGDGPNAFDPTGSWVPASKTDVRLLLDTIDRLRSDRARLSEQCPCSVGERMSGHRVGCVVPEIVKA